MFTKTRIYDVGRRSAKIDANKLFAKIWRLENVQKYIIELNTKEQLYELHIDSNGQPLQWRNHRYGYSKQYYDKQLGLKEYGERFRVGQEYTLRNTNYFYRSFEVLVRSYGFEIIANPVKEGGNLYDDFGEQIVGLAEESRGKLIEYILPLLADELENYLLNG